MVPPDAILSDRTAREAASFASAGTSGSGNLVAEVQAIRGLVNECEKEIQAGQARRLPGNVTFLSDGRVLCRERSRGDSRYPYGSDGFNFWVNASGKMSANQGLFFLFLPAREGLEPPIAFFSGFRPQGAESFTSHSLLPTPFVSEGEERVRDRYSIIGHDATYFVVETPETFSTVRVFLDQSRPESTHIHFSILIQNLQAHPLEVFTSAYLNPFCRHQFVETSEDRWFKKIAVESCPTIAGELWRNRNAGSVVLPPFVVSTNEDVHRGQSITNYAIVRRVISLVDSLTSSELELSLDRNAASAATHLDCQECTSRLGYIGSARRSLNTASFLKAGRLEREVALTVFNENAIIGDLLRLALPSASSFRADYVFSVPDGREVLDLEMEQPFGPADTDQALQFVRNQVRIPGDLAITVYGSSSPNLDAHTFNRFIPFLKKQVAVCATLKGYIHPSANSLVGFRDVLQAVDCHLLDRPAEARAKMLELLSYVLVDGRCPRQYSLPVNGSPGRADLREFIDQGVWAISTVFNYVAVTGDASFLEEQVGYHRKHPTDDNGVVPAGQKDSVLEHLLRIMDYLDRQRDPETGLALALYGDWNDALDGLGMTSDPQEQFGTGVSVMTSLQLYGNCSEILELLGAYAPGRFAEHVERFSQLRSQLRQGLLRFAIVCEGKKRRIVHGWGDRRSFFVGSYQDSDGLARDSLTSNSFWILSGMLEEEPSMRSDILAAFERLDSKYGLKTFEPGFAPSALGIGRITKLPLGTAENGATYVHATTFAIAALFRMGEDRKAWEQIAKILPFAAHHLDPSHSPFVMPNSYVDNPLLNLTGQSMNDWQTGSSNALLKLLVRYGFGFQPCMKHLRIAPAEWLPFESYEFNAVASGRQLRITYTHDKVNHREIWFNGELQNAMTKAKPNSWSEAILPYSHLRPNAINEVFIKDPLRPGN